MMRDKKQKKTTVPTGHSRLWAIYLVLAITLVTGAAPIASWAKDNAKDNAVEIPFADADLYLELNNSDGDLGFHSSIDGEAWKRLVIEDPRDRKILNIFVRSKLRRQGLTQLFFESAEPPFDELAPDVFFRRFPEGEYEIEGKTLDGGELSSTAELTHVLAAPPENIEVNGVPVGAHCDEGPGPSMSGPLVITWDEVTESHPELGRTGEPVEVDLYQVVVEHLDMGLTFTADLPPTATEVIVPETFTDFPGDFKLEILVKESSGNQTATETCFTVE
jgi:hypothetical protein